VHFVVERLTLKQGPPNPILDPSFSKQLRVLTGLDFPKPGLKFDLFSSSYRAISGNQTIGLMVKVIVAELVNPLVSVARKVIVVL